MPDYRHFPLFGLNTVLFPGMSLPLHIFEPRYRLLLARCIERSEPFGIVLLKSGVEVEAISQERAVPHRIGTVARITRCEWLSDGRASIAVVGESRFAIERTFDDDPYLTGQVELVRDEPADPQEVAPLSDQVTSEFRLYLAQALRVSGRDIEALKLPTDPCSLSFAVAAALPIPAAQKQKLLATFFTTDRLTVELQTLRTERDVLESMASRRISDTPTSKSASSPAEAVVLPVDPDSLRRSLSRN